jgi:hypothetical protein
MGLPNLFIANTPAMASQVNDNFAFVMSLLGDLSEPGRVRTLSEFQFGIRQNGLLTGAHDTGPNANRFLQLSYNADWNLSGGKWKFKRYESGYAATALRLGINGLEVYTTSTTSGNLDAEMNNVFAIRATTGADYIYMPNSMPIQNIDSTADGNEDFRTTLTFLDTPKTIYDSQQLNKGLDVLDAGDYGVPSLASGLLITTDVVSSSGYLKIYQERSVSTRHWKYGFISRTGGSGVCQLGEGSHKGKFVIERTNSITSASVFIAGFYL